MTVDPARLVELAASSESSIAAMGEDWAGAQEDLITACDGLGDALGTANVSAAYADALTDAGEVVAALAYALDLGVSGLVEAARDAVSADDAVASEIARATSVLSPGQIGLSPHQSGGR